VAWAHNSDDIYAQKLDVLGNLLWGATGIPVCTFAGQQCCPVLAPDGEGGVIIAWKDERVGISDDDIYAQRINFLGNAVWAANGVPVCTAASFQTSPVITADRVGGVIVAWEDRRSGNDDIYAQRIKNDGSPKWPVDGVAICTASLAQVFPAIAPDGLSGAIIGWQDWRNAGAPDVYAQRVGSNGVTQWLTDGVAIRVGPEWNSHPRMVSDGYRGAMMTWYGGSPRDVWAQHLDEDGVAKWTPGGVKVCTATNDQDASVIVEVGSARSIIAWSDCRFETPTVYALRVLDSPSAAPEDNRPPAALDVRPPMPNPFSERAQFNIGSPESSPLRIEVYDVAGRRVRSQALNVSAGWQRITFDGRDSSGHTLPSGVYFYRVASPTSVVTGKMVIAR
jgi:hypothetical protein